jgi:hypothetical protein
VEDLESFKNRKTIVNVKVKDEKGKDTGEINVEIVWDDKNEGKGEEEEKKRAAAEAAAAEKKRREEEEEKKKRAAAEAAAAEKKRREEEEEREKEKKKRENKRNEEGSEKKSRSIKPSSSGSNDVLRIRIIDGKFYEKQDIFGSGDPYIRILFNDETRKTKVYHNTKSATYNESMLYINKHICI